MSHYHDLFGDSQVSSGVKTPTVKKKLELIGSLPEIARAKRIENAFWQDFNTYLNQVLNVRIKLGRVADKELMISLVSRHSDSCREKLLAERKAIFWIRKTPNAAHEMNKICRWAALDYKKQPGDK